MLTEQEIKNLDFIRDSSNEVLLKGKDENGEPNIKTVFRLHQRIFKETCISCPGKILGYIKRLKVINIEQMEEKLKSEYKLKSGKMLLVRGTSKAVTDHNITDELAVQLLTENPNRIALFSKFPKNWKEQTSVKKDEAKTAKKEQSSVRKDEELSLSELRERHPNITARSKKGFLKDLKDFQSS